MPSVLQDELRPACARVLDVQCAFWFGYADALPWDPTTTATVVSGLSIIAVLLGIIALRAGGAALMAQTGYGKHFNVFIVWFFVPFTAEISLSRALTRS